MLWAKWKKAAETLNIDTDSDEEIRKRKRRQNAKNILSDNEEPMESSRDT